MAPDLIYVPALAGKQLADAETVLTAVGLVSETVRDQSGHYNTGTYVITSDPPAGSLAPWGGIVTLIISSGEEESPSTSTIAP